MGGMEPACIQDCAVELQRRTRNSNAAKIPYPDRHWLQHALTRHRSDDYPCKRFGDLTGYLLRHKSRQFARALTAKLLTYGLGRSLELADEETVDDLTARFIESDYRLQQLITMIVTSKPFRGG